MTKKKKILKNGINDNLNYFNRENYKQSMDRNYPSNLNGNHSNNYNAICAKLYNEFKRSKKQ